MHKIYTSFFLWALYHKFKIWNQSAMAKLTEPCAMLSSIIVIYHVCFFFKINFKFWLFHKKSKKNIWQAVIQGV